MSVTLDPRKAHAVHHNGDVLLILTWVNDERAMVLMPAHLLPGSPWFIICESSAFRIADLVMNYLPDLIRMPQAPEPDGVPDRPYLHHLKKLFPLTSD